MIQPTTLENIVKQMEYFSIYNKTQGTPNAPRMIFFIEECIPIIKKLIDDAKDRDPCVHCGKPTAYGSGNWVGRIPSDLPNGEIAEGRFACAMCAGYECDECSKQIEIDSEIIVQDLHGHRMAYHANCYCERRHGRAQVDQ